MTPERLRPAHLGWRLAQTFVDNALVTAFVLAVAFVVGLLPDAFAFPGLSDLRREPIDSAKQLARLLPTAGALLVFYWSVKLSYHTAFLTWCEGQTPGCRLFHLRVVQHNGCPVTWRGALGRTLVGGVMGHIPIVGQAMRLLDYFATLFTQRRQAIRDIAAGTVLVHAGADSRMGILV